MGRIFVSHAHEDSDAAHQITANLAKAGLEPWLDVQELCTGDELLRRIAKIIAEAEYFVAVARLTDPSRTWVFRSPDDRAPLRAERYFTQTDLTPANPFASLTEGRDLESVGFDLATFDDLDLLRR